ncbi:MAG TPA: neutral zinc metallopeptidase [Longimicrobiaceae bacterium]|nr:neutral zinc metallopeptidase [Longimicrobiaceae bacterium]
MRWRGLRSSSNVEDRRGMGPGVAIGGGLGAVVIAIVALLFGVDPGTILQQQPSGGPAVTSPAPAPPASDEDALFVSKVLGSTEDVWSGIFQQRGLQYTDPKLDLFTGAVQTGCGFSQAAVGPFYCPRDEKVYLDLDFLHQLQSRLGAGGDFAEAYIIAHEVGHHVQDLLGITRQVEAASGGRSETGAGGLSVRVELQADCFAGVWATHAEARWKVLEPGDLEEAIDAAGAVGDDALQRQGQGYVVPDSFTHGTSAQRVRWFRRGYDQGTIDACDTFNAAEL